MSYYSIKEIERILPAQRKIIRVEVENNWVVIILDNNIKIKIRKF